MELQVWDLIKIIKKRLLPIIIMSFMAMGAALFVSLNFISPRYEVSTTLLIQPQNSDDRISYDDLMANEKLVPTFELIVKSHKTAHDVIQRLKLDISEEELLEYVEVTGLRNSLLTKITIRHPDPAQAVAIANGFAQAFREALPGIMNVGNVSILDIADLGENPAPVSPNPYFNMVVVFILVLNIGACTAVLLELHDKTVKHESLLGSLLGKPVLAVITGLAVSGMNKERAVIQESNPLITEDFRKLRTGIWHNKAGGKTGVLLITSPLPGEGKSYIAANLAAALARERKRVLLVDCNLRSPSIHKIFNLPNEKGLSVILMEGIAPEECIHSGVRDNLHIMTGGPEPNNPTELLGDTRMELLVERLKSNYHCIIMDSAPVNTVADTQVLAKLPDVVLLVARLGKTPCESVIKAKNMIDLVGANFIGSVAISKKIRVSSPNQLREITAGKSAGTADLSSVQNAVIT